MTYPQPEPTPPTQPQPQWGPPWPPDYGPAPTWQQGTPPATPPAAKAVKRRSWWRRGWFVAPTCLLAGFILGGIGASQSNATSTTLAAASSPAPAVTVTKTVTAPAASGKPAPAVTVTKTVTAPAAPTQAAAAITDDGTYLVGADIQPGTYVADAPGDCYWARRSDTTGSLDSIIANHNGGGHQTVTIAKTDKAFQTEGCGPWTKR